MGTFMQVPQVNVILILWGNYFLGAITLRKAKVASRNI